MKNLKIFAVILFVMGMIASSCEGPEGPRGPAGTAGTDGTDGTDGNANVSVYGFPADTFTAAINSHSYTIPITSEVFDSSFFLGYYYSSGGWYEVGQMGAIGAYQSRSWLYVYSTYTTYGVRIHNVDGSAYSGSDVIWDSLRVFVVPANQFYAAEPLVDFSNYKEVKDYFGTK